MNNKRFVAKICWLPFEKGGRKVIPASDKYAPIIKILQNQMNQNEFWSVFVVNKTIVSETESLAEIEYLSENAPDNLERDVEFELFEGSKLVAKGVVIHQVH